MWNEVRDKQKQEAIIRCGCCRHIIDVDTAELVLFMPHLCFDTCISSSVDFNDGALARAGGFLHRSASTRFSRAVTPSPEPQRRFQLRFGTPNID